MPGSPAIWWSGEAEASSNRFRERPLTRREGPLYIYLFYGAEDASGVEREAARYVLYHALLTVLKLLAPFLPHITDAI